MIWEGDVGGDVTVELQFGIVPGGNGLCGGWFGRFVPLRRDVAGLVGWVGKDYQDLFFFSLVNLCFWRVRLWLVD